ncbi:MAG: antitoxin VbhA family protein [Alphaproteobacteria bacterium]|nr:antitoxin VbhA family protein [Alphaproteobacteria bacterium]
MNEIKPAKPKVRISAAEMGRRREAVRQADADNRIEGLHPSPSETPIYEEFIRGDIDWSELTKRIQAAWPRP